MKQVPEDLTIDQKDIFSKIIENIDESISVGMVWNNMIALSGAAGTGKTYLVAKIIDALEDKYDITVTAPTHKAVSVIRDYLEDNDISNANARTIHSFLNIKLFRNFDKGTSSFIPDKKKDNNTTDILIVDESSMVSEDLFDYIHESIVAENVKVVLFVGDPYQLLPVDSNSNILKNIPLHHKLKKVVRQAEESYIIKQSIIVREMIKTNEYRALDEFLENGLLPNVQVFHSPDEFHADFCKNDKWWEEDKVIASYSNKDVEYHNKTIRKKYWKDQQLIDPDVITSGDKLIMQDANVQGEYILHQNNDHVKVSSSKKEFFKELNIYYWDCKDEYNKPFRVVDPDFKKQYNEVMDKIAAAAKVEKSYAERKKKWKAFYELKEFFVDVKYSFSSTIHKLQGSTYDTVYIDLYNTNMLNRQNKDTIYRLIYVAITRASNEVKILMPSYNFNRVESIEKSLHEAFPDDINALLQICKNEK